MIRKTVREKKATGKRNNLADGTLSNWPEAGVRRPRSRATARTSTKAVRGKQKRECRAKEWGEDGGSGG